MNSTEPLSNPTWPPLWPEIVDERVRQAIARIPRSRFVPTHLRPWAHTDAPLPIGGGQTISQPFIVALMTQILALQPGEKVLEIGTGSGYQTAVLCELTRWPEQETDPSVYSVERNPRLAGRAAQTLQRLGYAPHLRTGDGGAGWPEGAPFAAIIATAAAIALPRPLFAQLEEGGRIVIPIGPAQEEQILWLIYKRNGQAVAIRQGVVRFVPFVSPILDDPTQCMEIPCAS